MAVASCSNDVPGPWLQTWIEFQVDARINECLREMMRSDAEAAEGKLQVSSQLSALHAEQQDFRVRLEMLTVEMKQKSGGNEPMRFANEALEALQALRDRTEKEAAHRQDLTKRLAGVEDKLKLWDDIETRFAEHSKLMAEFRIEHNKAHVEQKLMRDELLKLLSGLMGAGSDKLAAVSTSQYDVMKANQGDLKQELHDMVSKRLADSQTAVFNEISRELQEWRLGLRRELRREFGVDEIRHDVRDLSAETKELENAIAALDEQLWLTDQRLGQRIDDVAHAQGMHLSRRQHDAVTSGSKAQVGATKAFTVAEEEVAVSEIPDTLGYAKATPERRPVVRHTALTTAHEAAATMMENCQKDTVTTSPEVPGQARDVHLHINVRRHQESHGSELDSHERQSAAGIFGKASPLKFHQSP